MVIDEREARARAELQQRVTAVARLHEVTERDRLTRPQPPAAIPPRAPASPSPTPGNLAYTLLGAQVIK